MKSIHSLSVAVCAAAAACAMSACTQPNPYGTTGAPPPPHQGGNASPPTETMPDANTRYDTRPSPGNTMPQRSTGTPTDVPDPNVGGAPTNTRPMPGTPPPMQY
ncbi:hypothetical protein BMUNKI379_09775 [Burkholderia multivorans]|uniref:hypothetical protein n=1 Tax=Burkholderia multivorans TaxID=87883 RepID=UPI0006C7F68D|nr:hypothetical protein [Burkholderia multivorans]KPJ35112.1 hypothetical protein BMUNKI379_09775 [Burkholderia multivorans]MDN8011943.1 hypothetical protein [Burkholderia multivorans]